VAPWRASRGFGRPIRRCDRSRWSRRSVRR
jgi:hypothetical protein